MEQNRLKEILDREDIELFNEMPWIQECTNIPTVFQIYKDEIYSYPLLEIVRSTSSGESTIEPRYFFGRNQDYSEIYVFDKMLKREGEEFYVPMTHVGRAFKVGLHKIQTDNIKDILVDY